MKNTKLTKDMKDIGEPPVLRRQVQLQVVAGFLVPLPATRSESVFSKILLILFQESLIGLEIINVIFIYIIIILT